jgi:tetratricopeptide (TPR) repeat protein
VELGPGDKLGKLTVERRIGRGAFGVVYLAHDPLIGREVALKVVRSVDDEHDQVLREARLIGKLVHANIVTLHAVHPPHDSDAWGFEFEFVDGGTLRDLVSAGPVHPDRLLELARGIAAGLEAAHRAGVVHGDIKPTNVLITREGVPKIADFGLGRLLGDLSLRLSDAGGAVGTPPFMAPEVLMGERATLVSDVWSLGVVLYWMACGRLPFPDSHIHALLYAAQNREPAAPPSGTPPEVEGAIRACLAKHPDDRPADASHVAQILRTEGEPPVPRAAPARPPAFTRLRGRDAEVARLRERIETAHNERTGCCVLLSGEAGIGKTAVAREAVRWAEALGFVWVQARVSAFEGVVRPLLRGVQSVRVEPDRPSAGHESASERIDRVLESSDRLRIDESQPALAALERAVGEILDARRLGVVIEDLHAGNADDVRFTSDLARRLAARGAVVLLCARPTGRGGAVHGLASARFVELVELEPLAREQSYALLEDRASALVAPEVARRIHATAGGNPRFLSELLRHMHESGCLAELEGRIVPGAHWEAFKLPRRLRDLIADRLAQLPEEDRELLDVAAVGGTEFDSDDVAAVVGRPVLGVLRRLQGIYRERGLVVPLERGYRFSTPLVEEVIYRELAPDLRRVVHRAFAERLADRAGVDPERLAVHWDRAHEAEKAAPWYRAAALEAAGRLEMHRAIDLAARGGVRADALDPRTASEHRDLLLRIAGFHCDLGQPEAAEKIAEALLSALQGEGEETFRLRVLVRRARWRYGLEGEQAVDLKVLERAGRKLPPCYERVLAHNLLAIIHKFRGDLDAAEAQLGKSMAALDSYHHDGLKSSALDLQASVALRRGRLEKAERLFGEAARLSEACGRLRNAATSDVNRILASFQRGALDGLEADLTNAIRTLELEDILALAGHARVILAMVQYAEGDRDAAQQELEQTVPLLAERRYWLGLGDGLVLLGGLRAVAGQYEEALEVLREAEALGREHGFLQPRCTALAWQAKCRVALGETEEALRAARACHELLRATDDAAVRREAVGLLVEAVVMGLPLDGFPAEDLAPEERSVAVVRAAHEWRAGTGTDALRAAAAALRDPTLAERRTELRILADLLESEALRREGEEVSAAHVASGAHQRARSLGHAWFERTLRERSG